MLFGPLDRLEIGYHTGPNALCTTVLGDVVFSTSMLCSEFLKKQVAAVVTAMKTDHSIA
jgi:hypothetical protein